MRSLVPTVALVLGLSTTLALPALAQEATAEVRTWSGQTLTLAQPSLDVYYTVLPSKEEGAASVPTGAPPAGGRQGAQLFGSIQALSTLFEEKAEPQAAYRPARHVTLVKGGVERRLPVASVAALFFFRKPVDSTLPPYVADTHYRYSAAAVLTDGSRVEADSVNLGATVLRGQAGPARATIPWTELEVVRFSR